MESYALYVCIVFFPTFSYYLSVSLSIYISNLLFLWSNRCWQFGLWFLCLFEVWLVRLEVLSLHTVEAYLVEFWALPCWHVKWAQSYSNLNILWGCFPLGLEWKLTFSCGHCWVFQICWHIECNTLTAFSFRIWNSSAGIPLLALALFVVLLYVLLPPLLNSFCFF